MATPGPWEAGERCIWGLSRSPSRDYEVVTDGPGGEGGVGSTNDADFIATMHPGVGLALADWLDWTFDQGHEGDADDSGCSECAPALAVARLINGGAE